jgi:hypothetical protein
VDQLNGVDKWSKPTKPPFSLNFAAMHPLIRHEAKGTVLIISPFNYPIWLSIGPLVRIPMTPPLVPAKGQLSMSVDSGWSYRGW